MSTTAPLVNPITNLNPFHEIGRSGLTRFGGYIFADPLHELQSWDRAYKVYHEMSHNDAVIGSLIFAIKSLCRTVNWRVHPAASRTEDLEAATFLDECRQDMETTWADVIVEALTMLVYGWALSEIVYKQRLGPDEKDPTKHSKYRDGRIGWRKIPLRAQSSLFHWIFTEDGSGDVVAMRQLSPPDYILKDIPLSKCLLFRTTAEAGNPQGRSILRNAVRAWRFRQNIEELEGIGCERDLAGLPVVRIPASVLTGNDDASAAARTGYFQLASNVKRDSNEGVVMPSDCWENTNVEMYSLGLLAACGRREIDTDAVINRYNSAILGTVLADFIMIGHEGVGAHELHTSKFDVFTAAITAYLDIIAEQFNRVAIPRLFALNPEFKITELPRVEHDEVAGTDLTILGNYLKALHSAGVPIEASDEMITHLHTVADLPHAELQH